MVQSLCRIHHNILSVSFCLSPSGATAAQELTGSGRGWFWPLSPLLGLESAAMLPGVFIWDGLGGCFYSAPEKDFEKVRRTMWWIQPRKHQHHNNNNNMDVLGDTPQYTQPRVQTHESGFMGINRFLTKYKTICSLVTWKVVRFLSWNLSSSLRLWMDEL